MAKIKAQDMTLKTFFTKNEYEIPEYQRSYAWSKTELEDLKDDIFLLLESNDNSSHFLGQIVIHTEHTDAIRNFIIDGQQRITSIIIFVAVIKELYERELDKINKSTSYNDQDLINDIKNSIEDINHVYIGKKTRRNDTIKLKLGRIADDYFVERILKINENSSGESSRNTSRLVSDLNPSEKKIDAAYKFFFKVLNEKLTDDFEQNVDWLNTLLNSIDDRILISYIETDDQTQAFIIFETLNARGMNLATSDLLKNHIIRTAHDDSRNGIIKKWDGMIDTLENIDPTRYIRSYWNSNKDFSRDKTLYKKFRNEYNNSMKVESLMKDLDQYSTLYRTLVNPELYAHNNTKITKYLVDLKQINASTFYPLIIALTRKNFDQHDIIRGLKTIITYYVRNIVIAGKVSNQTEIFFSKLALKVSKGEIETIDEIIRAIEFETIRDDEFQQYFSNFVSNDTKQIRYLLMQIELSHSGTEKLVDKENIHIEHIMPRSNDIWKYDEEMHKLYVNRFGNLTLLGPEYNSLASNHLFLEKITQYKKSQILLTKQLTTYVSWGSNEIEERQTSLSHLAIKIWKLENSFDH